MPKACTSSDLVAKDTETPQIELNRFLYARQIYLTLMSSCDFPVAVIVGVKDVWAVAMDFPVTNKKKRNTPLSMTRRQRG